MRREDYNRLLSRPIAVSTEYIVTSRLYDLVPGSGKLDEAWISTNELDRQRQRVSQIGRTAVATVSERIPQDMGKRYSPSVIWIRAAQYNWVKLATDYVVMAAKIRDGKLSSVPLLEPNGTLGEHQVSRPLAA